jgi:hypothetical protein
LLTELNTSGFDIAPSGKGFLQTTKESQEYTLTLLSSSVQKGLYFMGFDV